MSIVFADDWLTVHHGDARAILPALDSESIDAVVTSPPYWRQRSYLADDDPLKPLELGSEPTLEGWVDNLPPSGWELGRRHLLDSGNFAQFWYTKNLPLNSGANHGAQTVTSSVNDRGIGIQFAVGTSGSGLLGAGIPETQVLLLG